MQAQGATSSIGVPVSFGAPVARRMAPELDFELIASDGEPLDSNWQRLQIHLLTDVVKILMAERDCRDFFVGGDMFVYYDPQQARGIATNPGTREHFKGPDVFFVSGVEPGDREYWVTWIEGRYPELIVELISPSSESKDRGVNRDLYERTFRTPEYFLYDPAKGELEGLRLVRGSYRPIRPGADGRLWSERFQAFVGLWYGTYGVAKRTWVRLFDRDGRLLPTEAEVERQQTEAERQRAEAAEAEVARLRAELEKLDR